MSNENWNHQEWLQTAYDAISEHVFPEVYKPNTIIVSLGYPSHRAAHGECVIGDGRRWKWRKPALILISPVDYSECANTEHVKEGTSSVLHLLTIITHEACHVLQFKSGYKRSSEAHGPRFAEIATSVGLQKDEYGLWSKPTDALTIALRNIESMLPMIPYLSPVKRASSRSPKPKIIPVSTADWQCSCGQTIKGPKELRARCETCLSLFRPGIVEV